MHRFKNILAIYGTEPGSDDVLRHARDLAIANKAHLTLMDVLPARYAAEAELVERRKCLERLGAAIRNEHGNSVSVLVLAGTPFLEIIVQVMLESHDLVIASAASSASAKTFFLGSTAIHLMRKCPCPVWIIKPGQSLDNPRVLACIDPRRGALHPSPLDRQIVELSESLAQRNDGELHVVHVWDVEGSDRNILASEAPDAKRNAIVAKHGADHRTLVEVVMRASLKTDTAYRLHLPRSTQPARDIAQIADEMHIDVIVMGTVSRTGIPGLIMGNAAESVLQTVRCGLFTVKPPGFVSPVELEPQHLPRRRSLAAIR